MIVPITNRHLSAREHICLVLKSFLLVEQGLFHFSVGVLLGLVSLLFSTASELFGKLIAQVTSTIVQSFRFFAQFGLVRGVIAVRHVS